MLLLVQRTARINYNFSASLIGVAAATAAAAATAFTAVTTAECEKAPVKCLEIADKMFDQNQYKQLYDLLKGSILRAPEDAELHWRL